MPTRFLLACTAALIVAASASGCAPMPYAMPDGAVINCDRILDARASLDCRERHREIMREAQRAREKQAARDSQPARDGQLPRDGQPARAERRE